MLQAFDAKQGYKRRSAQNESRRLTTFGKVANLKNDNIRERTGRK
jgi:hypothetical protein